MNEREFEIGNNRFQLSKIDPFKQFHIVRRLGPILGDIIPIAQKVMAMNKSEEISESEKFDQIAVLVSPIMTGLSKLSDADADLVLLGLCSAVEIHQPSSNSWGRLVRDKTFMFQTLELPEILEIAGRAFAFNLSGFFRSAPQGSLALK